MDHVQTVKTELTLVIIGIEMLLKGAIPSRKIRTMKWIKVKARHYITNKQKEVKIYHQTNNNNC